MNFLVQWQPESLADMRVPTVRPRVYLNDFERAMELPTGVLSAETDPLNDEYLRIVAPEARSGQPYDAFKADIYALGNLFHKEFEQVRDAQPTVDGEVSLTYLYPRSNIPMYSFCGLSWSV